MPVFFADLHIHSRYSRATSKSLTLRNIAAWSVVKGIDVVATGDFTHPGWLKEIETYLEEKDNGLLVLKSEYKKAIEKELGWWDEGTFLNREVYFILSCEISSIYKKDKKVRKIHNVVFFPSLSSVKKFNRYLEKIGNLEADGRPILGFDSEDLLKLVLDTDPCGFLIPAHIWTPWFSLFGANSGFDSIEECFGSLSSEIFALETGLSSDPEMNWLWSELDRFCLVSNSDAHSGEKLAREANMFSGEISYSLIYRSLKEKKGSFLGTIEFFPEEGKYHLDGHRKCKVVLDPKESIKLGNICPVCKQPITIGVLHRIVTLADRETPKKPEGHPGFLSFIPLCEIIAEILGGSTKSKGVLNLYKKLIRRFGPELYILKDLPVEELKPISTWLAEAIKRMRERRVYRKPGFDGQYGQISLFTPEERKEIKKGRKLMNLARTTASFSRPIFALSRKTEKAREISMADYNPDQKKAIAFLSAPVLVVAGPGTGKTRTLIGRLEYLMSFEDPKDILVVTFSRAAAREIRNRISKIGANNALPQIDTLHAVAFELWVQQHRKRPVLLSEEESKNIFKQANAGYSQKELSILWNHITLARERADGLEDELKIFYERYSALKRELNVLDYQDLLKFWIELLDQNPFGHYKHVLVDEAQDLSLLQLKIVKRLLPESGIGLFAIGDPNQSIYSFRGAIADIKKEFLKMWPHLKVIYLTHNYRSKQNILNLAGSVFDIRLTSTREGEGEITLYSSQNQRQEAIWISKKIKELIGGTSHVEADIGMSGGLSPSEIGILFRIKALIPFYKNILESYGIPVYVLEDLCFWDDPRIDLILKEAERVLGLNLTGEKKLDDEVVKKGPVAIANAYKNTPPFDPLFWRSKNFEYLKKLYELKGLWEEVLTTINLEKDFLQLSQKAQKVFLITIHASKGMEFEAVFMPALEDGILPLKVETITKSYGFENSNTEEEKRLFYVGLTRAKSHLFLSFSKKRTLFNKEVSLNPSPFIDLLPLEYAKRVEVKRKKVKKEKRLKLI